MKIAKQSLVFLGIAIAIGLLSGFIRGFPELPKNEGFCENPQTYLWIEANEASSFVETPRAIFLDVRSFEEYRNGHITGAIHFALEKDKLPSEKKHLLNPRVTLIIYDDTSDSCDAAIEVANLLAKEGFRDLRILRGGFPAWTETHLPAEAGECLLCP